MHWKRKLSALSLAVSLLPVASGVAAAPLNFDQAWQTLQQVNDGLKAEMSAAERAQKMAQASDGLNLPKVDLNAQVTRLSDPLSMDLKEIQPFPTLAPKLDQIIGDVLGPELGSKVLAKLKGIPTETDLSNQTVKTAGVNALWVIYSGGRISAAQSAAYAQASEAQQQFALKRLQAFSDLTRFYYGVTLAQNVYQTRTQVAQALAQHLMHAQKLEQHGQIAKVERLSAQVAYDRAKVEAENARRELEIAQLVLDELLHQNDVQPSSPLVTKLTLPSLSTLVRDALNANPAMSLLDAKDKQAQSLEKAERGRYLPNVAAFGNYNLYHDDSILGERAPDWMVGVGVSVPLVDNSGRNDLLAAAHMARKEVGYRRAELQRQLKVGVEQAYRELEQAKTEYDSLQSSQALAKENFLLRSKAFEQGLATSLDVVDARMTEAAIDTQRLAASYRMTNALAKLLTLTGQPDAFNRYQR
ncbi:TolC family protein [Plesiomonas shigelloides]|uniref:TolC family protein n=1 Tax=Plesiomonas shigelloides TaxID=703 RepID=UPI0015AA7B15|nr:TolC family protein [Plesiomonas shigelloides]